MQADDVGVRAKAVQHHVVVLINSDTVLSAEPLRALLLSHALQGQASLAVVNCRHGAATDFFEHLEVVILVLCVRRGAKLI